MILRMAEQEAPPAWEGNSSQARGDTKSQLVCAVTDVKKQLVINLNRSNSQNAYIGSVLSREFFETL